MVIVFEGTIHKQISNQTELPPPSRPPTYLLCPRDSGVGTEHKRLLQTAQILAILNLRCYLLSSSASC